MTFLGRFLRGVLRDLATWFKDEALFNTDSKKGTPDLLGFKMAPVDASPVAWVEFKKFVKKIHYKLGSVRLHFNTFFSQLTTIKGHGCLSHTF